MRRLVFLSLLLTASGCSPDVDASSKVTVTPGKAYYSGGARLPVTVSNGTDREVGAIEVRCAMFNAEGVLIETANVHFAGLKPGAVAHGEAFPTTLQAARVECSAVT